MLITIILLIVVVAFTIAIGFIISHKNEAELTEEKFTDDVGTILENEDDEEIIWGDRDE